MNTIYFLGIPTDPSLVSEELTSFFDENVSTLLLFDSPTIDPNSEWNYIVEMKEVFQNTGVTSSPLGKNIYLKENGENETDENIAQNFLNRIDEIVSEFPNTRIAYCTLGSILNKQGSWKQKILNSEQTKYSFVVIDCDSFTDGNFENFSKFVAVVNPRAFSTFNSKLKSSTLKDRSGIFFDKNEDSTWPNNTYINKTFDDIVDETALTYVNKNPIIAWSGGIDSTTILASFIKNRINFKVTVNNRVIIENKEVYNFIKDRYEVINIPDNLNLSGLNLDGTIVTGEGCDQLYPKIHHDFIPGFLSLTEILITKNIKDYDNILLQPVDSSYLYNNVKEYFISRYQKRFKTTMSNAEEYYDSYVVPIMNKMPIDIKHYYQLHFMFKLIFNYEHNIKDSSLDKYYNTVESFYDNLDFQRWAITNLDYNFEEYGKNYIVYKQPNKNYNYSVFGMESLLNQIKMHSTNRNFLTKEIIMPKSISYYST